MSISINEVFASIFYDIYTYDRKYNELKSNQKLNVMKYPYQIRKLVYDNYNLIKDINENALTMEELEEIMNKDPEVKYVKTPKNNMQIFIDNSINLSADNVKLFNHLTSEDYDYINGDENDKNHMILTQIVKYNKNVLNTPEDIWNINYYLENNIYPIYNNYDNNILFNVIEYNNLKKIIITNDLKSIEKILIKRFVNNSSDVFELAKQITIPEQINNKEHKYVNLMECSDKNKLIELIEEFIISKYSNNPTIYNFEEDIIKYSYNKVLDYYLSFDNLNKDLYIYSIFGNKNKVDELFNKISLNLNENAINEEKQNFIIKLYNIYAKNYHSIDYYENFGEYFNDKYRYVYYYVLLCDCYKIDINTSILNKLTESLNFSEYNLNRSILFNKLLEYDTGKLFIKSFDIDLYFAIILNNLSENILNDILYKCVEAKKLNELFEALEKHNIKESEIINYYHKCLYIILSIDIKNDNQENKQYFENSLNNFIEKYKDEENNLRNSNKFDNNNNARHTLGYYYIVAYKSVPPLSIYSHPSVEDLARIWEDKTSMETPLEMTNAKYYDYMIKNNGNKRPAHITALYSYFSNTAENKLIFIQNDETLDHPAKLRYIIPIEYELVKEFITEDLDTNDICLFTTISNADWKKIANDNDRLDIVAFSDYKNIYKERSSVKKLLEFFKDAIEMKFDCKLTTEDFE